MKNNYSKNNFFTTALGVISITYLIVPPLIIVAK